jgi:hypothetical protein
MNKVNQSANDALTLLVKHAVRLWQPFVFMRILFTKSKEEKRAGVVSCDRSKDKCSTRNTEETNSTANKHINTFSKKI